MQKPNIHPFEQAVIDIVKRKREEKGMSQEDLAHSLNVTPGFIGQVEGYKYPAKYNLVHINNLALIFGCSPHDLIPKTPMKLSPFL